MDDLALTILYYILAAFGVVALLVALWAGFVMLLNKGPKP